MLLNYLDILKIQNTYIAEIYYSYKKYCDICYSYMDYPFKVDYFLSVSYPYFQGIDYFINRHIFVNICNKRYNIFYNIYNLKSRQLGRYNKGGTL